MLRLWLAAARRLRPRRGGPLDAGRQTMAWTQLSDIESRWIGDLPPGVDVGYIETAIEDVEDQLIVMAPDLVDEFGGLVPLDRVRRVVARVIIRHLHNPEGVRVRSEATGPVTASVTHSGDDPGALIVTASDLDILRAGAGRRRAYGVSLIPEHSFESVRPGLPDVWTTF